MYCVLILLLAFSLVDPLPLSLVKPVVRGRSTTDGAVIAHMQCYLLIRREQPTGQSCSHMEGKTCEVIIEISTKLTSGLQEQLIFQWAMQHSCRYLVLIVYIEAGEAAVPSFWQTVAITTDLKQKPQQKTTKNRMMEEFYQLIIIFQYHVRP